MTPCAHRLCLRAHASLEQHHFLACPTGWLCRCLEHTCLVACLQTSVGACHDKAWGICETLIGDDCTPQDELARARNGILLHRSPSGDHLDASPLQPDDQRSPPELQRSPAGSQNPGTGAEAAREESYRKATLDDKTHVLLHRSRQLIRSDDGMHGS